MLITVRCYLIPADITFDTNDVIIELYKEDDYAVVIFNTESEDPVKVYVDRQHYENQKREAK